MEAPYAMQLQPARERCVLDGAAAAAGVAGHRPAEGTDGVCSRAGMNPATPPVFWRFFYEDEFSIGVWQFALQFVGKLY